MKVLALINSVIDPPFQWSTAQMGFFLNYYLPSLLQPPMSVLCSLESTTIASAMVLRGRNPTHDPAVHPFQAPLFSI